MAIITQQSVQSAGANSLLMNTDEHFVVIIYRVGWRHCLKLFVLDHLLNKPACDFGFSQHPVPVHKAVCPLCSEAESKVVAVGVVDGRVAPRGNFHWGWGALTLQNPTFPVSQLQQLSATLSLISVLSLTNCHNPNKRSSGLIKTLIHSKRLPSIVALR